MPIASLFQGVLQLIEGWQSVSLASVSDQRRGFTNDLTHSLAHILGCYAINGRRIFIQPDLIEDANLQFN
jgi:hypothetical protein